MKKPNTNTALRDGRYTINLVYTRESGPRFVAYFGLEWIGSHGTEEAARRACDDHYQARMAPARAAIAEYAEFMSGYKTALLWSSGDDDIYMVDHELSGAADEKIRRDCVRFFTENYDDIAAASVSYPEWFARGGFALAGHDFALTRNGHGAGFWDGDLPVALGQRLTLASEKAGPAEPYIGDDGLIYIE